MVDTTDLVVYTKSVQLVVQRGLGANDDRDGDARPAARTDVAELADAPGEAAGRSLNPEGRDTT